MKKFSFVVPTYNRENLVCETIDSVLRIPSPFLDELEIIVVDDASTDATLSKLEGCYKTEISEDLLRIIPLAENVGVTGAKNAGANHARGNWIIFLDSDDLFIPENSETFFSKLNNFPEVGLFFFRCIDFDGNLIGPQAQDRKIELKAYFDEGLPGECLPVMHKSIAKEYPYEASLRGFEGVTYAQILANKHNVQLSNTNARKYRTTNSDRLSTRAAIIRRSARMASGYRKIIEIYRQHIGFPSPNLILKLMIYVLISKIAIFN